MAYNKKETDTNADTAVTTPSTKGRSARKKVYEQAIESELPADLIALFKRDNYDLKLIRWSLLGDEDYKYLTQREKEGYEFVKADELPDNFKNGVRLIDTKGHAGMVILGDLCLMKIDSDLRKSRIAHFQGKTDQQMDAVDINVLEKKGFKNLGYRSKVMMKEPTFQE
jgi:hypothetical protein